MGRIQTISRLVLAACLVFVAVEPAGADDVSVSVTVSPTVVPVGNDATLTVVVQGKFRKSTAPELPPLDDFYLYESGTSQNFSIVNGAMSSSVTYHYTLVPQKEGLYKIGPIRVTLGDKEYTADPVSLEVVAAQSAIPPQTGGQGGSPGGADRPAEESGGETRKRDRSIFVKATIDRDTVYVNQQVTWTLGYYSDGRVNLLRSPNYTPPTAEGFWVEDLPPQNKYYTTLDSRQYLVNEIKRGYFPTSPGLHDIGEARVDVVLDDFDRRDFDDFFSRTFRSRGFGKSQSLMTESKRIVVLPLPSAGRPGDFAGVVAERLRLSMAADKQVAQVGEPINVTIEINGAGNIKTIAPPPFADMESFKVYESGSSSDVFKKDYVVTGRKQFDYVVIPKVQGKLTISPLRMSYFDPVQKRYLVAQSLPVQLDVQPGAKEEGRKVIYAGGGDDFEVISKDIRYIHPVPSVITAAPGYLYQNKTFVAIHILPVFAVVFSLALEKRRRRYRDDVGFARASRAFKEADKKLAAGRRLFGAGRPEEGFAALSGAVEGYLADKMNVSPSGLTAETVDDFLLGRSVDEETRRRLRDVLAACDRARYAAGTFSTESAPQTLEQAREVLRSLEKEWLK